MIRQYQSIVYQRCERELSVNMRIAHINNLLKWQAKAQNKIQCLPLDFFFLLSNFASFHSISLLLHTHTETSAREWHQ